MRASQPEDTRPASAAGTEIRIGISSCLLGEKVRFDGGHKRDGFITGTLSSFVRFVPVCPEVEVGMGIPRESVRLEREGDEVRMIAPKSGTDHTESMRRYARDRVAALRKLDLSGYILKSKSPSCGMERVRVYSTKGMPTKNGRGLFAEELLEECPRLPVEEEGRLCDPRLRENFIERVFAYRRVKDLFAGRWRSGDLVRFHTGEKLLLMAHDPGAYRALGKLVADVKGRAKAEVAEEYQDLYMAALSRIATTRKHRNVLQHIQGYFKKLLSPEDKRELIGVIDDYAAGLVPLIVPITLVRHYVRLYDVEYLKGQVYLEPHPKEMMLRNHV